MARNGIRKSQVTGVGGSLPPEDAFEQDLEAAKVAGKAGVPREPRDPNTPPHIDIFTCSPAAFKNYVQEHVEWCKEHPLPEDAALPYPSNGWYEVTPDMALDGLRRNPPKANRSVAFSTVLYYAKQMRAGQWMRTGQSLLFTTDGKLLDGQHREWAGYLSGFTFPTFVVMDVPVHPNLFAYVDNVRARTPTSALETAGYSNAGTMASVLRVYDSFVAGVYTYKSKGSLPKTPPVDVLHLASTLPHVQLATDLAADNFRTAASFVRNRVEIIGFIILWLLEHGASEDLIRQFLDDFIQSEPSDYKAGNRVEPLIWLRWFLAKDAKKLLKDQIPPHHALGYMILGFNRWLAGERVKRLDLSSGEEFPTFDDPAQREAAE